MGNNRYEGTQTEKNLMAGQGINIPTLHPRQKKKVMSRLPLCF